MTDPLRLSIVIPALDEASTLPSLLDDLYSQQRGLSLEIIVVDGGSRDDTVAECQDWARRTGATLRVLQTHAGRGHQMNWGAHHASADVLLFLHADSRLSSADWLNASLAGFEQSLDRAPGGRIAAHHPLRFGAGNRGDSVAYFYFAAKSALNLPEAINGDQGLWISKRYFRELGGFDESLPYMEDARLARKIFVTGRWVTLPDVLVTSPRRFESQGLARRQFVNGLLRLFDAAQCAAYFVLARDAYNRQSAASRLKVLPFVAAAHRCVWQGGLRAGLRRSWRLATVIAQQCWQPFFFIDVIAARRRGLPPREVAPRWLNRYQRFVSPVMRSRIAIFGVALALVITLGIGRIAALVAESVGFNTTAGNDTSMDVHTTDHSTKEETAHK